MTKSIPTTENRGNWGAVFWSNALFLSERLLGWEGSNELTTGSPRHNDHVSLFKVEFAKRLSSDAWRIGVLRNTEVGATACPLNRWWCFFINLLLASLLTIAPILPFPGQSHCSLVLLQTSIELNSLESVQKLCSTFHLYILMVFIIFSLTMILSFTELKGFSFAF